MQYFITFLITIIIINDKNLLHKIIILLSSWLDWIILNPIKVLLFISVLSFITVLTDKLRYRVKRLLWF